MAYENGDFLVRAVMTAYSGLPADECTNDFAFRTLSTEAPTDVELSGVLSAVSDFYRVNHTNPTAVGGYISNAINRAATHRLVAYKIVDGPLGSPFHDEPWLGPPAAIAATGLPTEVSAVLSFAADMTGAVEESGATRPRARRRGRVFIGPLALGALDSVDPPYLLGTGMTASLREGAVALVDAANAAGCEWSVWSREDKTLRPILGGWTDNAPDIQRRRGVASTARVVWG